MMVSVSGGRPPAGGEVQRWVLESPTDLRPMRESLRQAIIGRPMPDDAVPDDVVKIVLVASELAANGLVHGRPPTIVRLLRTTACLILDVEDHEPAVPPEYVHDRAPSAGGMGLQLARKLAVDVGWYVSGRTKHVWAQFPATPATAAPG
jgi:hypothetical protein